MLPNNYMLVEQEQAKALFYSITSRKFPVSELRTFLYNPAGKKVIKSPISEFAVSQEYVYGWVHDSQGETALFYLDTRTGAFRTFESERELQAITDALKLPPLNMKNSFTFLDIATGYKQPTWTAAEPRQY